MIDGTRKIIGYEDLETIRAGRLHAAFDLALDPEERTSVHAAEAWPAELLRRHAAELEVLLTPLVERVEVRRMPEQLEELRNLGYSGEEDDVADE